MARRGTFQVSQAKRYPKNESGFVRVKQNSPCAICGKVSWCTRSGDGVLAYCMRVAAGSVKQIANKAYVHVLTANPSYVPQTDWRRIDDGGLDDIEGWLKDHPDARLVVVDTLKRVRPPERPGRIYNDDYDAIAPLADLAKQYGVAIVVVHHTRKQDGEDPVDLVSGSTGLTGAADGVCVLTRMRRQTGAELFVTGRDFEETSLALEWDKDTRQWKHVGEASEFKMSVERRAIIDVIRSNGGKASRKEIADALGKPSSTVGKNLFDMKKDLQVSCDDDGNYIEGSMFGNPGNAGNGVTGVTTVNGFYNYVPKQWDEADLPF